MGKRTPSPPPAPDPVATSQAQGAANRETAIAQAGLNAVNQRTPYGSLEYNQIGTWADGTPRFEATQYQTPEMVGLSNLGIQGQTLAAQTGINQLSNVASSLSRPLDISDQALGNKIQVGASASRPTQYNIAGAGDITRSITDAGQITRDVDMTNQIADVGQARRSFDFTGLGDPNISRDRVEEALFNRLNPQLERDRQALEQRLVNQGVTPGSPAWTRAQQEFGQNVNDARNSAILNAGQEQSRLAGLGLSQAQLFNAGQGQDFGQAATRSQFFNDANIQRGTFQNAAQAQQFGQNFDRAQFANAAQNQQFGQNATQGQFANQAQQQEYQQAYNNVGLNNNARQQMINERLLSRQTPLNEFSALLSGAQVQQPNFINTPGTQIQPTDVAGPIYQNYQGALNNYNQQIGQRNATMGGLFGLAGAGLGGYLRGGF